MGQNISSTHPLTFTSFEIAIRKAAEVYDEKQFIVVGRGSVAVTLPGSSDDLRRTNDIYLFAPFDPMKAYNKLEGGLPKDLEFMREGLRCRAYSFEEVSNFITRFAPEDETRRLVLENLRQAAAE